MKSRISHTQNVMESGSATVTSGGHWFNATRDSIEHYVPGLLKKVDYENLILDAVEWIESTDSIALVLYFILVFYIPVWLATVVSAGFYLIWYYNKSAFVNLAMTPVLKLINHDAFQIGIAAIALSFLGIYGNYAGLLIGIIFFFLFKVGLLRLAINWAEGKWMEKKMNSDEDQSTKNQLSLNDRVLKMILIRHSIREDAIPRDVQSMEDHLKEAFLKFKEKRARGFKKKQ